MEFSVFFYWVPKMLEFYLRFIFIGVKLQFGIKNLG